MSKSSSPQLEDGYTRIANELFDAIISFDFSKREQKIILCVIRKTYGFGKRVDDMTLTQIANATGLHLAHVSCTVSDLSSRNILLKRQGGYGFILGINKDYGQWRALPKRQGVTETVSEPYHNGNLTLPKQQPQKKPPKETTNTNSRFSEFWIAYPRKVAKGAAEKAFAKVHPDENLFLDIMQAVGRQSQSEQWQSDNGKYILHPATWLTQQRWEDEVVGSMPWERTDEFAGAI